MRVKNPIVVLGPDGRPFQGASVQTRIRATNADAPVFAAETGATAGSNPATTDANGEVDQWLPRGAYACTVTGTGLTTRIIPLDVAPGSPDSIDADWVDDDAIGAGLVAVRQADGSVAWTQVGSEGIGPGVVGPTQLAAGAVGTRELADGAVTDVKVLAANRDGSPGVHSMRTLGTGAQQACAGNDVRLSDMRVPIDGSVTAGKLASARYASSSIATPVAVSSSFTEVLRLTPSTAGRPWVLLASGILVAGAVAAAAEARFEWSTDGTVWSLTGIVGVPLVTSLGASERQEFSLLAVKTNADVGSPRYVRLTARETAGAIDVDDVTMVAFEL